MPQAHEHRLTHKPPVIWLVLAVQHLARGRDRITSAIGRALIRPLRPVIGHAFYQLLAKGTSNALNFVLYAVFTWLLLWWLAPRLLVSSASGLEQLAQAIPAAIVAVLVFILGAIFAVAQVSLNAYGFRSAMLLLEDPVILHLAIRPLILAAAALLLAGQIPPPSEDPGEALTAGFAALTLTTIVASFASIRLMLATLLRYTAPVSFVGGALQAIPNHMLAGSSAAIKWRPAMLEEMGKLAIRRGDSAALNAAVRGLENVNAMYLGFLPFRPDLRVFHALAPDGLMPPGSPRPEPVTGWMGEEMGACFTRLGDDALRAEAPSEDLDLIVRTFENVGHGYINSHLDMEALGVVRGFIRLGCSTNQVGATHVNYLTQTAGCLARIVAHSELESRAEVAAQALAGWAVVVSYYQVHAFPPTDPIGQISTWRSCIEDFGPAPPWDAAAAVLRSVDFRRTWANQLTGGVDLPQAHLAFARLHHAELHAGRDLFPLPPWTFVTLMASMATSDHPPWSPDSTRNGE